MAFQIVDDILDVVATDDELGKPAGNDLVQGVYTLPVIRVLAGGGPDAEQAGRPAGPTPLRGRAGRGPRRWCGPAGRSTARSRWPAATPTTAAASLDGLSGSEAGTALVAASDHLVETVRVAGRR